MSIYSLLLFLNINIHIVCIMQPPYTRWRTSFVTTEFTAAFPVSESSVVAAYKKLILDLILPAAICYDRSW